MCNGFCKLVKVVLDDNSSNSADHLKVYALAFMAVNLRDAVSIFSRVTNMSQGLLSDLNTVSTAKDILMQQHCL